MRKGSDLLGGGQVPRLGTELRQPGFREYAASYGAKGSCVETADGLVPAQEAAFRAGGVHLVAVPVDYSENTQWEISW
jgi:acetolactate synthase I/II/III large subunit